MISNVIPSSCGSVHSAQQTTHKTQTTHIDVHHVFVACDTEFSPHQSKGHVGQDIQPGAIFRCCDFLQHFQHRGAGASDAELPCVDRSFAYTKRTCSLYSSREGGQDKDSRRTGGQGGQQQQQQRKSNTKTFQRLFPPTTGSIRPRQ